jgi:hypothetical protein
MPEKWSFSSLEITPQRTFSVHTHKKSRHLNSGVPKLANVGKESEVKS